MTTKQYIKCDAEGRELPPDSTDYAIVFDPATNIEWLADFLPSELSFENSQKATAEFPLAGGGWHVPDYHESASIVDVSRFAPARDPVFRGPATGAMWTSTPYAPDPKHYAWIVSLNNGSVYLNYQYGEFWVRPCRARRAPSQ